MRFIDVEVGWPGSVNDARIFKNSRLNHGLKAWLSQFPSSYVTTGYAGNVTIQEEIPAFILGDSAYPNSVHIVPTFKLGECNSDPVVAALNGKLGGARYRVENAFGILKGRFQIFQRPMNCSTEDVRFAILLISACFVLHNFLIDVRDESGEWAIDLSDERDENGALERDPEMDVNPLLPAPEATRERLLRHMRCLLNGDDSD